MLCTQILEASALLLRWRANGALCEPWETAPSSDAAKRRPDAPRFGDPLGTARLGPFRQHFCAGDHRACTALNPDARKCARQHARAPSGLAFSPALRRRAPPCLALQPRIAQTHVARLR
ncbi:unnamed protein product [Rangifer tarandus platyrhynchus]|uniref:Uncharacterized protein n=1 Tax=Rangifer tarandus platyrhynchus TaxID=3082113 RepID=A0AC60A8K2_RANTA